MSIKMVPVKPVSTNGFKSNKRNMRAVSGWPGLGFPKSHTVSTVCYLRVKNRSKTVPRPLIRGKEYVPFQASSLTNPGLFTNAAAYEKKWMSNIWLEGEIKIRKKKKRFRHLVNIRKNRILRREMRRGGCCFRKRHKESKSYHYTPPNQ